MKHLHDEPPANQPSRSKMARKPRDDRWRDILEAAAIIFHEKGYSAATLQDIADRVGILKGSIYYYIKTKPDLLEALLTQVHNDGLAMVRAQAAVAGNALDKLASVIFGYVTYIIDNQAKSAVYIHEVQRLPPAHRTRILRDHSLRTEMQALIEQGQSEGLIADDLDSQLTAQVMLSGLNAIYQWYRPEKARPRNVLVDHLIRSTLHSIASAKGLAYIKATLPAVR
jgi:AcrR family transcriptional regulator